LLKKNEYLFSNEISLKRSYKVDYDITDNLGSGAFGVVRKARSIADPSIFVAIKSIKKCDCKPEELYAEVKLLRLLSGSKGIVQMHAVYESVEKVNIVMEYISGGELFDAILENEFYSELEASKLVKQIASIVEFLHGKNIVHRDLKPENLLFSDKQNNTLKLIDFGIATIIENGKKLLEVVGSRSYMAPEIHTRTGYSKPVDNYAIGVIMYILLCGYPPFDYDQGIYELAFNSPEWDDISMNAKELITNLLQDDPTKRHTANTLLKHPWLQGIGTSRAPLGQNLKGTIKNFKEYNSLVAAMAGNYRGQEGRGTIKSTDPQTAGKNTTSTANQRRLSIFGAFNIVKETKELEAQSRQQIDFEQETPKSQNNANSKIESRSFQNQPPSSIPNSRGDAQKNVVGGQRITPKEEKPVNANNNNKSVPNQANTKQPQINQPNKQPGQKLDPQAEVESINNLKNDLRQHGKAFNKLKQDLIAYSRTTENDLLRRQLLKTAEEINILTNSYKSTFDSIIPVLNKASQLATNENK